MTRPRLLDLFSGAGGAAMGYSRAGFDVTGVDHRPQPRYPFAHVVADALEYLAAHGREYDAIHASPPCQAYTTMNNRRRGRRVVKDNPRLIALAFALLDASGRPFVMENVEGAGVEFRGRHVVRLTGEHFGLAVHRPRLFASSILLLTSPAPRKRRTPVAVYGRMDARHLNQRADGTWQRGCASLEEASAAMGIDWMTWDELREAIPPAFTHYLGKQLLRALEGLSC